MRFDIQHRPAFALAIVHLEPNETVVAESGAMVSMDTGITMETTSASKPGEGLVGALFGGLKRMVAGESFFQNRYTATAPSTITFAPTLVGDIAVVELQQTTLLVQSKSYLCSAPTVSVDAKWSGARGFFAGEGMVMLKATGSGPIAFNSFGGIKEIDVQGEYIVDTGHIVAFEDTLKFTVTRFGGGWKSFIFSGEGLVCSFTGTGKLWIQTRNPVAFGQAIGAKLPMRES